MIELEAFATDCRVYGHVELGDQRMTDALNAASELRIRDARLEALSDGHVVEMPELSIERDELCAVVATGPRGDPLRRVHTNAIRVEVDLGPYHVEGAVHGTPASDPMKTALRRHSWVPLTDATVRYDDRGQAVRRDVTTLVVNRDLARMFRAVVEPSLFLPRAVPTAAPELALDASDLAGTPPDERARSGDDSAPAPEADPTA